MTFSIITPSFNQSDWLKLCVASVADQGVDCEHIIQDACSTDGTVEWLRKDSRVQCCSEPDGGMYDAINRGLRRARGDILSYLNCDEQYLPGALARAVAFFERHPEVDIVFGDIVMVDGRGEYLCHRKVQVPRLFHTWTCHLSTLSCAMFFRRRLIDSGQFFFNPDYRCGGDAEWMVRLLRAGASMGVLGKFTSVFTRTETNLSRDVRAGEENVRLARTAPFWMRWGAPLWVALHRVQRWRAGAYQQEPFAFNLFLPSRLENRAERRVDRPVFRQTW